MRFLCLHGTDTNAEFLEMQLAPLTNALVPEHHTFAYLPGPIPHPTPFPGLDPFPGPYFRYYDRQQLDLSALPRELTTPPDPATTTTTAAPVQQMTPEDWMRQLREHGQDHDRTGSAVEFVLGVLDRVARGEKVDGMLGTVNGEGAFDGIIGFSEGALVAADVILHQQRHPPTSPIKKLKLGVFIAGAPAWDYEKHRSLLADESEERIKVPSVSVIGTRDPIAEAGRALWGICEGGGKVEWEGGHAVPIGGEGWKAMVQGVRRGVNRARMMG